MTPKTPKALTSRMLSSSVGPHEGVLEEPRCTAWCKARDARCKNRPMRGGRVCRVHGGAAGQVRAAAQRRLQVQAVEAEVANELAFQSIEGVTNPLEAMSQLAAEVQATSEALAARVNALNAIRYSAVGSGTEQVRAEMTLLGQYQDRTARLLDMMIRSGFDNRKLLLDEHIAKASGALLGKFLDELMDSLRDALIAEGVTTAGFPVAWKTTIGRLFPAAFRALSKS